MPPPKKKSKTISDFFSKAQASTSSQSAPTTSSTENSSDFTSNEPEKDQVPLVKKSLPDISDKPHQPNITFKKTTIAGKA